jgi:GH25 family lysozyme M1 (1,4-beta-N-acetylmuramidase)
VTRGIDIHPYYQRTITSWASVKKAVSWVYVKASDGNAAYTKTVDGITYRPDTHARGAKGVGLPVGAYHYAQFGDPVRQANVLIAEHRRLGAVLPPMLDLEEPFEPNALAKDFAIKFLRRLEAVGEHRPAVYMSSADAKILRPDRWGIAGLIIWVASYSVNDGRQHALTGGYPGRVDIHQFTSKGRVSGISGDVDLNESKIALGAVTPGPAKPTPAKEEDDLDADAKRKIDELHAALRIGKVNVQTPGVLTRYIAETLTNGRKALGLLAGLQDAQRQLAASGKVDLVAVQKAAETGARQGADEAMADLEAELDKMANEEQETQV